MAGGNSSGNGSGGGGGGDRGGGAAAAGADDFDGRVMPHVRLHLWLENEGGEKRKEESDGEEEAENENENESEAENEEQDENEEEHDTTPEDSEPTSDHDEEDGDLVCHLVDARERNRSLEAEVLAHGVEKPDLREFDGEVGKEDEESALGLLPRSRNLVLGKG